MTSKRRKIALGTAVIGAVVGSIAAKKIWDNSSAKPLKEPSQFDKLIATQFVCDEVNGIILADWFKKQKEKSIESVVLFIAMPTKEAEKMFALEPLPKELDNKHYLLQVVVGEKDCDIKAIRLINFNTMASELSQLFGEKDYIIVDGGNINVSNDK